MKNQSMHSTFEIVNEQDYIWKTPKKIETTDNYLEMCPHCSKTLSPGFTLVPVGNKEKAKVPGYECRNCGILFAKRSKAVRNLLQDNKNAKEITLDGTFLWDYSFQKRCEKQRKKRMKKLHEKLAILSKISGGMILVTLKNEYEQLDYVISNNKNRQSFPNVMVVHYSTILAREIITSIYRSSRKIQLNGKEYEISRSYYPSDGRCVMRDLPNEIKPSEIRIKPGGGYYHVDNSNHDEIVDVLLFSPFTQRYELARATYNSIDGECFMDICIYRSFVKKYGNPGLSFFFNGASYSGLSFDELRTESILHAYGYSVSESDGLTEKERRELLTEIVDLELLTIPYIVNLLDFFSRTHTSDKYYLARGKWRRDMEYIADYKINTERFLIVK